MTIDATAFYPAAWHDAPMSIAEFEGGLMSDQNRAIFDFAAKELRAEISLFWQRSLFFWGFTAAAFVAYGVLIKDSDKDMALTVSCFGIVCSTAWALANRGSKYWQVAWEQKLQSVEKPVLGGDVYSRIEKNTDRKWWGAARYSVTRLTIAMSDFTVLIWITLAVKSSPIAETIPPGCYRVGLMILTGGYVIAILVGGRSRSRP